MDASDVATSAPLSALKRFSSHMQKEETYCSNKSPQESHYIVDVDDKVVVVVEYQRLQRDDRYPLHVFTMV